MKCGNNVLKLPGIVYVAKNWALAKMLKALPLVHFWSVLLWKEQMMTSVRKTLKMPVWWAQNRSISSEICPENNHKIGRFLPIAFLWSLPENSREIPAKSADFFANLSLKIPGNLTFSSTTYQKPWPVSGTMPSLLVLRLPSGGSLSTPKILSIGATLH